MNKMAFGNAWRYFLFALILLSVDQFIKLWMHFIVIPQHFGTIEIIPGIFDLHYITNRGMAFGMELGGEYGKLALTIFRLVAMFGIGWYLFSLSQKETSKIILYSISAILAGALGNLVDSIFYGVLLQNAPSDASTPWFHGQVIDMFYAKGLDGTWPEWLPLIGGQYHSTPIFNFADASIFCGVVAILLYQNKIIKSAPEKPETHKESNNVDQY